MKLRGIAVVAVLVAIACARIAHADEETGGSMGGGDFSDTSSSYSSSSTSSSSDYSTTPSYSYSGYDRDRSSSHGGGGGLGSGSAIAAILLVGLVLFAGIGAFVLLGVTGDAPGASSASTGARADVTVLRVAIDARARKRVQSELARIAGVADTKTAEGRAAMLREVALMLRRLRDSWVYGGAHNEPMMAMSSAEICFRGHVDEARGKFKAETVRNEQGAITRAAAPALHATSDDGPGVMLVSVIVAARHELFTVNRIGDGEDLRKALESLSTMVAGELVAVEIVWMPSAEDDRISSLALEAAYPRPDLIPIAGALVGKVFCEFCGSPYPAEAISCPSCGGRATVQITT